LRGVAYIYNRDIDVDVLCVSCLCDVCWISICDCPELDGWWAEQGDQGDLRTHGNWGLLDSPIDVRMGCPVALE
jgi:hypothetical protein